MSEADMLAYGMLAANVCKGIRNDDETLVMKSLNALNDNDLVRVYSLAMNDISFDCDINNLEPSVRKAVKKRRLRFDQLYRELLSFRYKWKELEKQPESYTKYQTQMSLLGKDPKSYHEWCDIQVYFQVGIR